MSEGINSVSLTGTLGQDADLKFTQSGTAVANLRLAVNKSVKDRDTGVWSEKAQWFTAILWGRRAEGIAKYLTKGTTVSILGELENREWEAKDGTKRRATEIKVEKIVFSGGNRSGSNGQGGGDQSQGAYDGPPQIEDDGFGTDDVPFATSAITTPNTRRCGRWDRW